MEANYPSEISTDFHRSSRPFNLEDLTLHINLCEKHKS
jgi:hypothetical protein